MPRKKIKDNCQFCQGAKGGIPGNEININGVLVCDECLFLVQQIRRRTIPATPVKQKITEYVPKHKPTKGNPIGPQPQPESHDAPPF